MNNTCLLETLSKRKFYACRNKTAVDNSGEPTGLSKLIYHLAYITILFLWYNVLQS